MKKRGIQTLLGVGLLALICSCNKRNPVGAEADNDPLSVRVELVGSSAWASRSEPTVYGRAVDLAGSDYRIVAHKQEWNGASDTTVAHAPVTRGTPITSASGIANVRVNVYRTGTSNWSTSTPRTATLAATYASGGFTTSPSYNWPTDPSAKTTLFAYSPVPTSANGLSENSSTPHLLTYAVPTTVGNQPDLCTAVPDKNVINSDGTRHVRTFGMAHQLTAVGFRMLGWNLKITNISVSGVYTQGVFDQNSSTWGLLSAKGSRSVGVTQSSYNHSHTSTPADITQANGYLMMIPQSFDDNAAVTITYTATSSAESGTMTAKLNELGVAWEAGDRVVYDIRLRTAPAVTSGNLTISNSAAGYTTTSALSIATDYLDNLTFTCTDASWLRVWKGSPTTGSKPSGSSFPWSTGTGGPWSNIYFYTETENPSTSSTRSATVTVSGTRSGKKSFTVTQAKKPAAVKIGNLYWALGNLVADGSTGCKIGAPTDYGLYFTFGGLVGWSGGGSSGDGTGQGSPSLSIKVKPSGYSGSGSWPAGRYTGGSSSTGYGLPSSDNASTGIGDPCRYYLGGSWRTPTAADYAVLCNNNGGVDAGYSWSAVGGSWVGSGVIGGNLSGTQLFFPASGFRDTSGGSFYSVTTGGYGWSSSVYNATYGLNLVFNSSWVYPQTIYGRSYGFPVRCVTTAP